MVQFRTTVASNVAKNKMLMNQAIDKEAAEYNAGMACKPFSDERQAHMVRSEEYAAIVPQYQARLQKAAEFEQDGIAKYEALKAQNVKKLKNDQGILSDITKAEESGTESLAELDRIMEGIRLEQGKNLLMKDTP